MTKYSLEARKVETPKRAMWGPVTPVLGWRASNHSAGKISAFTGPLSIGLWRGGKLTRSLSARAGVVASSLAPARQRGTVADLTASLESMMAAEERSYLIKMDLRRLDLVAPLLHSPC